MTPVGVQIFVNLLAVWQKHQTVFFNLSPQFSSEMKKIRGAQSHVLCLVLGLKPKSKKLYGNNFPLLKTWLSKMEYFSFLFVKKRLFIIVRDSPMFSPKFCNRWLKLNYSSINLHVTTLTRRYLSVSSYKLILKKY